MKKIILLAIIFANVSFLAEDDFISNVKNLSDNYFARTSRAKLELFFDQPKYSPGDTVRFRVWYVNANDLKSVNGMEIVHIAFFDQQGNKKMSQWAAVNKGASSNKFVIPDNFPSGNYVLVAFTERMKNFDQSLFYQRQFLVTGKNEFVKKKTRDTVVFFAEGESLVRDLENNLAVRYNGTKAKIDITIKESGRELMKLSLTNDSVSTFHLKPKSGETYEAEYVFDNESIKVPLPQILSSGLSVMYSDREINVERPEDNTLAKSQFYLLLYTAKGLMFYSPIDLSKDRKQKIVLPKNLSAEVAQVVIVDSKYKLWNSRVVSIDEKQSKTLTVEGLNGAYTTRQQVSANVRVQNNGRIGENKLSCRIINEELFAADEEQIDYLTFGSDLSNSFSTKAKFPNELAINNYLITQTCPWFNWQNVIDKNPKPLKKAEQYLTFSGHATLVKENKPVKDSTLLMFFLENNLNGYETYVTSNGHFSFPLVINITSKDHFFYTASYKGKDLSAIKLKLEDHDSLVSFKAEPMIESNVPDKYFMYSAQRKTINSSYSFFVNKKTLRDSTSDPNAAMEQKLKGYDVKLNLSDYLMMPTMADVSKELLRGVEYRLIGGRHVVRVNTTKKMPSNYAGPLYLINGQITKDPVYFIEMKPANVVSVKVVKDSYKLMALGALGANGVILVNTKTPVVINEKNRIEFSGLTPRFQNGMVNVNTNTPDLRSCLLLLPDVLPNGADASEIRFNTSDDVGKFKLQIYGLTEDGTSVFAEYPFTVNVSRN